MMRFWCDVIPMNIEHVILGRPWIYDMDIIIFYRSNSCSFSFNGRKIQLINLPPRPNDKNKKSKNLKKNRLNIISPSDFKNEVKKELIV
jgi:hypothetical protein